VLTAPASAAPSAEWRGVFEAARARAERALSRPVTHAVILFSRQPGGDEEGRLREAAELAGLSVLRLVAADGGPNDAVAAALLAEDLAPRPDFGA
jgi:molecular chaperone DnaK (HSP70)